MGGFEGCMSNDSDHSVQVTATACSTAYRTVSSLVPLTFTPGSGSSGLQLPSGSGSGLTPLDIPYIDGGEIQSTGRDTKIPACDVISESHISVKFSQIQSV